MKLKRFLIASIAFDIETAEAAFDIPTVSLYWNLENKEKPFKLTIKQGWILQEVDYSYNILMMYLKKKNNSIAALAKYEILERNPLYDGKCEQSNYYFSQKGRCVLASTSQEQVEKWIENDEL